MQDFERAIYERAIKTWGVQTQLDMVIEEMAELTKAIIKYRRDKGPMLDLLREGVDVQIMISQLETLFPAGNWQLEKRAKLHYVMEKLDKKGA